MIDLANTIADNATLLRDMIQNFAYATGHDMRMTYAAMAERYAGELAATIAKLREAIAKEKAGL